MTALLLALALQAQAAEAPPAAPDSATLSAPQAAEAGPAFAAAAPRPAPSPEAMLAPAMPSLVSALPAASALLALAAVALLLSRKKGGQGRRLVQVVETAHLGPKRQLVVARMGGQILLLGSSESGITLLSSRPADEEPALSLAPAPAMAAGPEPRPLSSLKDLWQKVRKAPAAPDPAGSFEAILQESSDDLELRRKLARGLSGKVA
ncbi:MAG TPA: flagellar biosynthetic protein FliO [Anaeromyxobacteraceae bacterium]|nr:flagellar biosynthetic protein FliO [Anaeromyxobacteraceae bacterium]